MIYHTYFGNGGTCKITKESLVVENEKITTTLYMVSVKMCKEEVNVVEDKSGGFWYIHPVHLSKKGLNIYEILNRTLLWSKDSFLIRQSD